MTDSLSYEEFGPQAESLPVGQSQYFPHCSKRRSMIVVRESDHVRAKCFKCGLSGQHRIEESLADKLARLNQERDAEHEAVQSLSLPEPREYDVTQWPKDLALWLYKAGFSHKMIDKLGAYYCAPLGRVVLPVYEDGELTFWQARSQSRKPKVMSPKLHRRGLVAKYGTGNTVVLCEDMLSAFKVGQFTEAWALLGTSLSDDALRELLYRGDDVIVWLDGDEPGRKAAAKINKTLRAYGLNVRDVVTDRDPKMHDRKQIEEILYQPRHDAVASAQVPEAL